MDGGNSAKRVDGSGHADERIFASDYHISSGAVDCFKDDVRNRSAARNQATTEMTGDGVQPPCTDNWKAANTVQESSVKIFEQTGIFISACRHGIMETFCEMRCSGEL